MSKNVAELLRAAQEVGLEFEAKRQSHVTAMRSLTALRKEFEAAFDALPAAHRPVFDRFRAALTQTQLDLNDAFED